MAHDARPGSGWQFSRLLAAPHRLLFSAAALVWLVAAGWWAAVLGLATRHTDTAAALHWAVPPALAHALLMTLGFLPLFFAGFLFTAGPRWLQAPAPDARALRGPTVAVLAGWGLLLPALHLDNRLAAIALLPAAAGHSLLVLQLARLCRQGQPGRRQHAVLASVGCGLCAAALWAAAAALASGATAALAALLAATLWLAIGGVLVVAAQRMSPWLADESPTPWLLLLAGQALTRAFDALGWPLPGPLRALLALALATLALRSAWALRHAALPHGQRTPMLRMLRAAAGWRSVALALAAAGHALALVGAGVRGDTTGPSAWAGPAATGHLPLAAALAMAATHALALGFCGGHLLVMASRISAVHNGRTSAADTVVWRLHLGLQALVAWRLAGALATPFITTPGLAADLHGALLAGVALGWAGLAAAWTTRHGPWLGQMARQRPGA